MQKFSLPYDRTTLEFTLPDDVKVEKLEPVPAKSLDKPREAFIAAIENPLGTPSLRDLVKSDPARILIVAQDHTRVCGKDRTLLWLADYLNGLGIPDSRMSILIALGSHKPASDEKLRETIGPVIDRVEVVQHDTSGPMTDYGTSSHGTRAIINARLKEADLVILLTSASHHYFAGYGGGRKIILPGIAALDSIASNHALTFSDAASGGRHPLVKSGSLDGNPVHEDMLESARMALAGRPYICIVSALLPNKEFGFFAAGELDRAHRRACEYIDKTNVLCIDKLADIVIASAGGYPKDVNVIQAHKGLDNAAMALKPGGTLLYLMNCSEGFGNQAIAEFAPLSLDDIRRHLSGGYVVYGQTVYAFKEKALKFRIVLVTGLDPQFVDSLGARCTSGIDNAMSLIGPELASSDLVYIIPRADLIVPTCLPDP